MERGGRQPPLKYSMYIPKIRHVYTEKKIGKRGCTLYPVYASIVGDDFPMCKKQPIAIFGAGKIGRAFIGQLFSKHGHGLLFIDVDRKVIDRLNSEGKYQAVTLNDDGSRDTYVVKDVQGAAPNKELGKRFQDIRIAVTSVGAGALPAVAKSIAALARERRRQGGVPFDVIIAENMRGGDKVMRGYLRELKVSKDAMPGLIAASVGKTAPDPTSSDIAVDPLIALGDSYKNLFVSADGWRNTPPKYADLRLVDNIDAYVDRKLFIHNLMHASFAYLGHVVDRKARYLYEVLTNEAATQQVLKAMSVVIVALEAEYGDVDFGADGLKEYLHDCLRRMGNPALRDTVWRIGRDVSRKIGYEERIVGAMRLVARHNLPLTNLAIIYCAALCFDAVNDEGKMDERDARMHEQLREDGIDHALHTLSGLNFDDTLEVRIANEIRDQYKEIEKLKGLSHLS